MPIKRLADKLGWSQNRLRKYMNRNNQLPPQELRDQWRLDSCFKKGQISHNKGIPMSEETREKVKRTWFKKGQKPHNTVEVGSIVQNHEGYFYIKIAHPSEWELLHRYVWKIFHKEIPPKHAIVFKDNDPTNCNIDNLECISLKENAFRNVNKFKDKPEEYKQAVFKIRSITRKINEYAKK